MHIYLKGLLCFKGYNPKIRPIWDSKQNKMGDNKVVAYMQLFINCEIVADLRLFRLGRREVTNFWSLISNQFATPL